MDACFEERLCEEIRSYQHLSNPSLKDYKDIHMASNSWREVAETHGRDESACWQKWKYLQDRYVKAKRKMKGQSCDAAAALFLRLCLCSSGKVSACSATSAYWSKGCNLFCSFECIMIFANIMLLFLVLKYFISVCVSVNKHRAAAGVRRSCPTPSSKTLLFSDSNIPQCGISSPENYPPTSSSSCGQSPPSSSSPTFEMTPVSWGRESSPPRLHPCSGPCCLDWTPCAAQKKRAWTNCSD